MANEDTLERLKTFIKDEKEALLTGNFERISELLEEKAALLAEIPHLEKDEEMLAPVRAGLRRNEELFDHALAGLRNVANRVGQANRLRKSLDTYDEAGRRTSLGEPGGKTLERRA